MITVEAVARYAYEIIAAYDAEANGVESPPWESVSQPEKELLYAKLAYYMETPENTISMLFSDENDGGDIEEQPESVRVKYTLLRQMALTLAPITAQ